MMNLDRYASETAIPGFFFVLSACAFVFAILGVDAALVGQATKDYLPYIAVLVVVTSHLIGELANSTLPIFFGRIWTWFLIRSQRDRESGHSNDQDFYLRGELALALRGTEELRDLLSRRYSKMMMFKSLAVAMPLLGIATALWVGTAQIRLALTVISGGFVCGALCFHAFWEMRERHWRLRTLAYEELLGHSTVPRNQAFRTSAIAPPASHSSSESSGRDDSSVDLLTKNVPSNAAERAVR